MCEENGESLQYDEIREMEQNRIGLCDKITLSIKQWHCTHSDI